MQIKSKQPHTGSLRGRQILESRKEIDPIRKRSASHGAGQELVDMLKETESDFSLDHVRDAIFHEEDNDDMIYPIGYDVSSNGVKSWLCLTPLESVPLLTGQVGAVMLRNLPR